MKHLPVIFYASALFFLGACNELKEYKSGGIGSINGGDIGDVTTLVTISGKVMSSATFHRFESQALGAEGLSAFGSALHAMSNSAYEPSPLIISSAAVSSNDCAGAVWTMSYVGSGGATVKSGAAATDGSFDVPSVPMGKEGLIIFNCSGMSQKCLVKGGDISVSCNTIADGVVGALEASLGKALTSTDFAEKSLAKVATSIVESSNTDTADAETLKSAVNSCRGLTDEAAKKTCYQNSLMASSQSATLEVAKTLAKNWDVRSLFNFVIGAAGLKIEVDNFIYTDLGDVVDASLGTDFVTETKILMEDLITNPDYINGDSTKGEQTFKIDCSVRYNKYQNGGVTNYKPSLETVNGKSIPSCKNISALTTLTGLSATDPKLVTFLSQIDTAQDKDMVQIGLPGDNDGDGIINNGEILYTGSDACQSWDLKGNFCLQIPTLLISSRMVEANRNDIIGEYSYTSNSERSISLLRPLNDVNIKAGQLVAYTSGLAPTDPLFQCFQMTGGSPVIGTSQTCKTYLQSQFSPLKKEFGGLIGAYMYLTNPSIYGTISSKLSLRDIHRVFSKSDFLSQFLVLNSQSKFANIKMTVSFDGNTWDQWIPPFVYVDTIELDDLFQYANNPTPPLYNPSNLPVSLSRGSLVDKFDLTFQDFSTIPTIPQIQSSVQYSSHHEPWNPMGSKLYDIPGLIIGGVKYPIYCKMSNRKRLDNSSNPLPMVKELNLSSKIECLANPVAAGVTTTATAGLYTTPSTFEYPFVMQQRGFQGDSKGQLFTLIEQKTGQSLRIGGSEIMILEGHAGNSNVLSPGSCPAGFSEPANSSDAPIIRANYNYGSGSGSRSEIITAYCLNMSSLLQNDSSTQPYRGGEVSVTTQGGSFKQTLAGGRLTTNNDFNLKSVCLFSTTLTFNFDSGLGRNMVTSSGLPPPINTTYTIGSSSDNSFITALNDPSDDIDFCDQTHSGTTKYYLTPAWTSTPYDSTTSARNDYPFGLTKVSDSSIVNNIYISLGAIEGNYSSPGTLKIANSTGRTWFFNIKLFNQKHNPKFDPFCDDLNNDGVCNCNILSTSNPKPISEACNLGDTPTEPTISNAPYWPNDPQIIKYQQFFHDFGGLAGIQLKWDHDASASTAAVPLDQNYFMNQQIYIRLEEVLQCQYLKTGETTFRRPTQIIHQNLANLNFPGCPNASGVIDSVTSWTVDGPANGGGPVRMINPKPMKNAYDVAYPKKFMTLLNYATKSIGQGVTIDPDEDLFSFDEALALIEMRKMLTPGINTISASAPMGNIENPSLIYYQMNQGVEEPQDQISALFFGLTKPVVLAAP